MKETKFKKVPEPALNNLFLRTYKAVDFKLEGLLVNATNKWGASYKTGPTTFEFASTYQLHKANFKKFVNNIERVADQDKESSKTPTGWLMYNKPKVAARFLQSQEKKRWAFRKAYDKFFDTYQETLKVILHCTHFRDPRRRIYFDTQFYPRDKEGQGLFSRFLAALLRLEGRHTLNTQGPTPGVRSIPPDVLNLADKMHNKGKGTTTGSREAIDEMVLKKTGYSLHDPNEKKFEAALKRKDAISRTLSRHFSRKNTRRK